ncbi:hypothetical protein [Mucilaginibacter ginsenosidivorans]|uniref:Uncharacterized protein n=1 Tax=Mucilaginibacter ginsenosidivorans TaxID=398053 RepID=A0A5B8US80_9SPHI|nr:hypothetical protein [Mucilaginibacter ginsenosidivorans]QEC61819.1 hypothetical protein FRZ54_04200 [Mucilaginibacter ginsenosidivorans]
MNNILKADTPSSLLIYYIIGLVLLVGAHHLSPTNLAGPGLDLPAFFIYFILALYLFLRTLLRVSKLKRPLTRQMAVNVFLSYIINFIGAAVVIILFFTPSNSW